MLEPFAKRFLVCLLALNLALPGLVLAQNEPGTSPDESSPESAGESAAGEEEGTREKRIYRARDKDGTVIFTDDPERTGATDVEEVRIEESNTLPMSVPKGALQAPEELEEDGQKVPEYQITIQSPQPEQHFHNPQEPIPVQVTVKPSPISGHRLQLVYDGTVLEKPEVPWPQIRGTHTLVARIVDQEGNLMAKTERVFYVHRPSKLLPPNNN